MRDQNAWFLEMLQVEGVLYFKQAVQHAAGEVAQVGGAFAKIFIVYVFEDGDVFFGGGMEGEFGVRLLRADDLDDFLDEHAILKHQQVRVKDVRLGRTHRLGHAPLNFGDLLARADERLLEPLDLGVHIVVSQLAPRDNVARLAQDKDFTAAHSRRNGDAAINFFTFDLT